MAIIYTYRYRWIGILQKIPYRVLILRNTHSNTLRKSNWGIAGNLFDEMPLPPPPLRSRRQPSTDSFTSAITRYLKINDLPKAISLFRKMPERTIVADSAMIHGYAKAGRMEEARKVFDTMADRNVFSWTSLISGYFRSCEVAEACLLFDQMPMKNVITWTTVLMGYARNGLIDQARDIFDQMPEKNTVAWTAMMRSYIENNQIDQACNLFYNMPQRNLYSWNIMISGCLDCEKVSEAIQLFDSMPLRNAITWTTMVTGLARNGLTTQAREYFDQMPKRDVAAWNAMITVYAEKGLMVEASQLFEMMHERDIVTWNAMIDGYVRFGPDGEALCLLTLMLRFSITPNDTTLTSAVTSCSAMLELMQVHALVISLGFEHDTSLSNALVTMYSRSGDISNARLAFENTRVKDTISWTAMILAYSNHGVGDHALYVFAQMLRSGTKPDPITFVGVLSACSHAGLVKKGERLFNSMSVAYGLEPKAEHYCCLVDILGRAGQVDQAMRVVREMPRGERDGAVLGALLGACKLHGDLEMAHRIGEELIELEPNSSGGYVLLGNVYAACGKWSEFARVRKTMKEREVKKVAGFSQIEVKGKSCVFFVGDRSHAGIDEIYEMLQVLMLVNTDNHEDSVLEDL